MRRRTRRLSLLIVASVLLIPPIVAGQQSEETLSFAPIVNYMDGGGHETGPASVFIVSRRRTWKQLWRLANEKFVPVPPLPEIDFDSRMVIAVFHDFACVPCKKSITKILRTENGLQLTVKYAQPGLNCGAFPGFVTRPIEIVEVERAEKSLREKEVQLILETVTVDCKPPA